MFEENTWNTGNNEENDNHEWNSTSNDVTSETQGTQTSQDEQGVQNTADTQSVQYSQDAQSSRPANPYPYNYYQNQGYGQNTQNQSPYGNPYQYNYYQNHGTSQNQGYGQNPYGQNPYNRNSQNNQNRNSQQNASRKKSFAGTLAMVTAAALVFGVVAGGTMFGVNRTAELMFPASTPVVQSETESPRVEVQTAPAVTQTVRGENSNGTALADVSGIVENTMPSVVSIINTTLYQSRGWFGQSQTYEIPSSGSGVIVGQNDTELLIVTNNHVIEGANELTVTFIDDTSVNAAIKGTDSEADLAVIAIPLDEISDETKAQIKVAVLGDSDALKLGEGVIAIGNALGRGQSVTVGYVSALNREIAVEGITKKVIQTDAAINPGNSGGALINGAGEIIGINEAKSGRSDTEGVGYAIPVSQVKDIIDDLMNRTTKIEVPEAERGYLGIQLQSVDAQASAIYGMPRGVFVYQIVEGTAAANSDLRERDIITKVNGERVQSSADFMDMMTYYRAGDTITLTVEYLEDNEYVEREVTITLGKRPADEN